METEADSPDPGFGSPPPITLSLLVKRWIAEDPTLRKHFRGDSGIVGCLCVNPKTFKMLPAAMVYERLVSVLIPESYDLNPSWTDEVFHPADPEFFQKLREALIKWHNRTISTWVCPTILD